MGKVVEKKKKKKGRPSLLDLQKRNLKLQQQQQQQEQQQNPKSNNPNPNSRNPVLTNPNPNRRFTRRNPNPDGITSNSDRIGGDEEDQEEEDEEEEEQGGGKKKKKKQLKPGYRQPAPNQRSSVNSPSYSNDSNAAEDGNSETPSKKKRKTNAGDRSALDNGEKGENRNSASKAKDDFTGTVLESGPTTPLPDQALLVFILDRLQKKDTYGVFSEPVDPNELPDYHEIIEHPMDFGTVRKKLSSGAYANLEQFEEDVFLICSNAMQYNSSDTIYFRQARSIHELAVKNFENLRQDSDDNEPEEKIVRRGRPPTKNLKKPLGRPPLERASSEFSDATLATGGDNGLWSNSYDLRKGPLPGKNGSAEAGRTLHGSHNNEIHRSMLADNRSERNDDFPGFTVKGMSMKSGKKQFILDENRRNTYKQSSQSAGGREPSVFSIFDEERRQLTAVGLHTEYCFARSLARFAANLGPIAWKIAAKKIERALPTGTKFGPGWVGENEASAQQARLVKSCPPRSLQSLSPPTPFQPRALPAESPKVACSTPSIVVANGEKLNVKQEASDLSSDGPPNRAPHSSISAPSSSVIPNKSPHPSSEPADIAKVNGGFSLVNLSGGMVRPIAPFQIHPNHPGFHRPMNGFTGGFGYNTASQMAKLVRPTRPTMSSVNAETATHPQMTDVVSRGDSDSIQSAPASQTEELKFAGNPNATNSGPSSLNPASLKAPSGTGSVLHPQPSSWRGLAPHQKTDSVPPDLNVSFQSPGSPPNSTVCVDSPQPDLVLQL